jgi:hypothetical protein
MRAYLPYSPTKHGNYSTYDEQNAEPPLHPLVSNIISAVTPKQRSNAKTILTHLANFNNHSSGTFKVEPDMSIVIHSKRVPRSNIPDILNLILKGCAVGGSAKIKCNSDRTERMTKTPGFWPFVRLLGETGMSTHIFQYPPIVDYMHKYRPR